MGGLCVALANRRDHRDYGPIRLRFSQCRHPGNKLEPEPIGNAHAVAMYSRTASSRAHGRRHGV
jgi:hypothetical protein